MHCARCSKAGMIEIRMRVAERDVTFRRCGRCEAQTWETTDGPVPARARPRARAHRLSACTRRVAARVSRRCRLAC